MLSELFNSVGRALRLWGFPGPESAPAIGSPVVTSDVVPPRAEPVADIITKFGSQRDLIRFHAMTGIRFQDIAVMIKESFPDASTPVLKDTGRKTFSISYAGEEYSNDFSIDLEKGIVRAGYLQSRSTTDRSIGRRMFAHRAVVGLCLGLHRQELQAALEMGAYVWAKAGARVDDEERADLSSRVQGRLSLIKHRLSTKEYRHIARLAKLHKKTDLYDIAHITRRLIKIDAIFDQQLETGYSLSEYATGFFANKKSMTIGQFLLVGDSYYAHISLTDQSQMARIEKYTTVPIREQARTFLGRPHPVRDLLKKTGARFSRLVGI